MKKTIYLAGGCFWGVEAFFKKIPGIIETTVGYSQGSKSDPQYEEVCTGTTGHTETVEIYYDDSILPLGKLLKIFFMIIDPTTLNRQGPDIGTQYRSGLYSKNDEDISYAKKFIASIQENYHSPIVVETERLSCFYRAEEYHQDYLDKNPGGYCHINMNSLKDLK